MNAPERYPLTADSIVFCYLDGQLQVALIKRKFPPFQDQWAFPGGFMEGDETALETAKRELEEETGIKGIDLEQSHVFSNPDRDPRGRVVTVAFFGLIPSSESTLHAADDANEAKWWPVSDLPPLAFDHEEIYRFALTSLQASMTVKPIVFNLLQEHFTLDDLQTIFEEIYQSKINKEFFQKELIAMPYIEESGDETDKKMLFHFNRAKPYKPALFRVLEQFA